MSESLTIKNVPARRGFTLIEAMVAMATFSVLMAAVFSSMATITNGIHTAYTVSDSDRMSNVAISRMSQSLFDAAVIAPAAPFASSHTVVFKVLYDGDGSGAPLAWGVNRINTPWNDSGWISYTFVKERDLIESQLGDINGDGDANDTFALGSIIKTMHSDNNGRRTMIILRNVLQTQTFGGDINGDGVNDPIFSLDNEKMVRISVWTYSRDNRGQHLISNQTAGVRLVN